MKLRKFLETLMVLIADIRYLFSKEAQEEREEDEEK